MDQVSHLYIHLPFCARRCAYCDFFSVTGALDYALPYVGAVARELEDYTGGAGPLNTIYFGGGTPTLIGADLLEKLLAGALARASAGVEITVEANPSTITEELAARLKAAGATRISLGVQTFLPRLRQNLDRSGDAGVVRRAVDLLRCAGFGNIGLDMIFGIPGQEPAELRRDIEGVLSLKPEHVSYYELTAKEGSPFRRKWGGKLDAIESWGRQFYETVVDSLEAAGYRWYETSNFALPGHECRHNLAYWGAEDYIGLGAGAWSTVGKLRWKNEEDIEGYIKSKGRPSREYEVLSALEKAQERLFLGLRCKAGVKLREVTSLIDAKQMKVLCMSGFLKKSDGFLFLTRKGRFMGNEVCARLLKSF